MVDEELGIGDSLKSYESSKNGESSHLLVIDKRMEPVPDAEAKDSFPSNSNECTSFISPGDEYRRDEFIRRKLEFSAKTMYFVRFAQSGISLSYMGIFLTNKGYTVFETSIVYAFLMTSMMIGSYAIPVLVDIGKTHLYTPLLLHLIGSIAMSVLPLIAETYGTEGNRLSITLSLIFAGGFCNGGFGTLVDSAVFQVVANYGANFGKMRLWGCPAWGISVMCVALVLDVFKNINYVWICFLILTPITIFATWTLLRGVFATTENKEPKGRKEKANSTTTPGIGDQLMELLRHPLTLPFMTALFCIGALFAAMNAFVYIWMTSVLGADYVLVGAAFLTLNFCEIPVFLYSGKVSEWIGVHGILYISGVTYGIRLYAYGYRVKNAWWTVVLEPLHAITFSLPMGTLGNFMMVLADESGAPRTSAQGLRQGTLNLGRTLGFIISGKLYQVYGSFNLFKIMLWTAVPLMLLAVMVLHFVARKNGEGELLFKNASRK